MGNEQQRIHSPHYQTIYINHARFRNVKVVNEGSQKLLKTTMGVYSEEYQKWRNELQQSCLDSHYLLLPKRHEYQEKALCGTSGTLELYFEDYRYVLSEQIHSRRENNILFDETDLWYLLLVLSSAQQEVRIKRNVKVGDIRPHNIFLNYEGEAKVSCAYTWPRQQVSFGETLDNQRSYLSPEEFVRIQRGLNLEPASFQSQVFSIGLTLLSAGLLEDFLQFYNIHSKSCKFNTQNANKLLDDWRAIKKYSQILTAVVSNLCQLKSENRIKDHQLWSWISQFKTQIVARKNFYIKSAPSIIERQITQNRNKFSQTQQALVHHLNFQQKQQEPNLQRNMYRDQNHVFNPYQDQSSSHLNLREYINPKYVQSYHESVPSTQTAVSSFYSAPKNKKSSTNQKLDKFGIQPQSNNFHKRKGSEKIGIKQSFENEYLIRPQLNLPDIQIPRMNLFEKVKPKVIPNISNNVPLNNNRNMLPQHIQFIRPSLAIDNQFKNMSPQRLPVNCRVRPNDNGLSYFQNVIDPEGRRGGNIEQTVYIQRSDYLNKYYRQ